MKLTGSITCRTLREICRVMDHEALLSRPGIGEPDSNFIWGSTFWAPIGISFIGENVFFNLLLPKGSENIPDKKMFLNRVEAKFYDDVWQVRRNIDQIKGAYGLPLKAAVAGAKSLTISNSYELPKASEKAFSDSRRSTLKSANLSGPNLIIEILS